MATESENRKSPLIENLGEEEESPNLSREQIEELKRVLPKQDISEVKAEMPTEDVNKFPISQENVLWTLHYVATHWNRN